MLGGPAVRRCWKHSRQNTGRPCVGLKGTVVSLPHCEQTVLVSTRCIFPEAEPALMLCPRFPLHALHRLGSFLKPLSAKNICSPAVNTNSAEQSEHFKILSLYSICHSRLGRRGSGAIHARRSLGFARDCCGSRLPAGMKLPEWTRVTWPNPAHAVASSGDVYARGLPLRDAFHRASYSNCAFLSL